VRSSKTMRRAASAGVLVLCLLGNGCSFLDRNVLGGDAPVQGTPGSVQGFLGGVVADEPRAAVAGRDVLSAGGDAADAAVAMGLMLAVTLPSRAGLGGGGACLAYDPKPDSVAGGRPEAVMFLPQAPAHPRAGDRPAAVPLLARGLYALHAKYGSLPFEQLSIAAEQAARFGVPASRALVQDIAVVARPLAGDPVARGIFLPGGAPLAEGATLRQPELAASLAKLRTAGVGDLYQGLLAQTLASAATDAGGGLSAEDFRTALPRIEPPIEVAAGNDRVAFLPQPGEGGPATQAAFESLRQKPGDNQQAGEQAEAVAARARGLDSLPALPASTSFAVLDRHGNAVVCALTMNNLFGTGRIAPGTGVLLAASPAVRPPPLLALTLAYNVRIHAFRAETGGTGQAAAPLAAALALEGALADRGLPATPLPAPPPEPGRANVIECTRYLPDADESCGWATDLRGAGLALGSN
jgi:gamma-glutamyltranspeptidase/glutathione hydrolase